MGIARIKSLWVSSLLLPIFIFSHKYKVIILFGLVYASLLVFSPKKSEYLLIHCPNKMAIQLDKSDVFEGRYLKCELYDSFQELIEERDLIGAEKLLMPSYEMHTSVAEH